MASLDKKERDQWARDTRSTRARQHKKKRLRRCARRRLRAESSTSARALPAALLATETLRVASSPYNLAPRPRPPPPPATAPRTLSVFERVAAPRLCSPSPARFFQQPLSPHPPTPPPPRFLRIMGVKRSASDATRVSTPRQNGSNIAKRQRTNVTGQSKPISTPPPATPARPPRMPRYMGDAMLKPALKRLDGMNAQQLIALLNKVEMRFRRLAAFEADEIRRAQKLGFAVTHQRRVYDHSPLNVALQTAAW
ncbi:hypothetical protein FGB62_22g544 [Gracilaria domingensis]|nr:hypothetical protein FGB62_22g544 [Gracilaria domingensis]